MGIGHTLNLPHGPLLKLNAYSKGKSSCPSIVPRYRLKLPAAHVLGPAVDVGKGTMAEVPVGARPETTVGYTASELLPKE
tara:strand:- start:2859 stop:3098 length:240 start_codon:yes stop_codon:yes gene_type:complete